MAPESQAQVIEAVDLTSPEGQRRLHKMFRYAQIGRCVSSVTHDVNNYLGAILAYAELIELDSELTKESSRMVQEIIGAVRKSSALINNLTDVARKERPDVRAVDPLQLIHRVLDLRRYEIKLSQIDLKSESPDAMPTLQIDLPKVEQALVYLVNNLIEALADEECRQARVHAVVGDGWVEFEFWNSGPAIPVELREAVFEPFFTTKAGEHVGLGLTVARETAHQHNGDLVYSPERGFVFRIPQHKRMEIGNLPVA